jgi:N-acetylmuramoyl-L-alanine amidase
VVVDVGGYSGSIGPRLIMPALMLLWMAAGTGNGHAAVLKSVRQTPYGHGVILQFQISGRARWHIGHQGSELLIDLPRTRADLPVRPLFGAERTPVSAVRTVATASGSQIEIEVSGRCDYIAASRGNQLLIGIQPAGAGTDFRTAFASMPPPRVRAAAVAHAAQVPPAPHMPQPSTSRPGQSVAAATPGIAGAVAARRDEVQRRPVLASITTSAGETPALVVIDPGHGGFDPGTRSPGGVMEKDLALQVAQRLAAELNRRGVKTLLTRDSDRYLSLRDRIALANRAGADLFVSVHMNWSPNPQAAGMQVYYLNNTTDRATLRLARMENNGESGANALPSNLNYILSDLRQQYKANESSILAQSMEQQTIAELRADYGDMIHGLGARRGPFYVLVGAQMPAVLVECGFLSNPHEAALLQSPGYQQALAQGLADTIVQYLNQEISAGTL